MGYCLGSMNECQPHFTFQSVYIRGSGYFMMVFYGMDVVVALFIAEVVAAWGVFIKMGGGALSKSLSANIFGTGRE